MKCVTFKLGVVAVIISAFSGFSSFSLADSPLATTPQKLTLLHTNDHHGRFWHNGHGEYGMAARKTLLDRLRSEAEKNGAAVLLLSGGDINTGVPESDLLDAEPDFKGMNLLGYDAMAIGNHEFDNPLAILDKQIAWANFPLLSANIYDKKTNKRRFQPYEIFEKKGLRIAVIGLTTEDTAKIGNPEFIGELEFRDPKSEAKQVIEELKRTQNPDIIIATTHMGHYDNGKHGINAPGDVGLARYLEPDTLDVIIGGHSQEPVCMEGPNISKKRFQPGEECQPDKQNGIFIMQAYEWGKYVGKADFTLKDGQLFLNNYELIPVNLTKKMDVNGEKQRVFIQDEIIKDKDVYAFLKPYQEKGQDKLNIKVAQSDGKLVGDRHVVRFKQTNLGRLIAAPHAAKAKADFGIMNSGGVRASIDSGDITYKDILTVQPFGNMITYTDMLGKEIIDYLNVVATKPVDSGAYAQFYGIEMIVTSSGVQEVLIQGKPIDLEKRYRFTLPSFNAAGGDGYPNIAHYEGNVNTGYVDADVLKEYLESKITIRVEDYAPKDEIRYQ